jgi:hypothetical protein
MKNLFIILIPIIIPVCSLCQQFDFKTDTITCDTITDISGSSNLEVDENNNIHICWHSVINPYSRRIYYSKRDCSTGLWSEPEIVSDTNVMSSRPSIAVEKNTGIPHIVYSVELDTFNYHSTEIVHAFKLPTLDWETEYISHDTVASMSANIFIDKNNKCHIVWESSNSIPMGRVFYANNIDGIWNTQILEDSSYYYGVGSDYPPSIAVTSNGIAYIAFIAGIDVIYSYVRLAKNEQPNGKQWKYEFIETPENHNFTVMIALQSDSILHAFISGNVELYYGPNNSYYTKKNIIEGTWSPMEFINSTGGIKSIVLDNSGKIHALQSPGGGGVLGYGVTYYTSNINGAWVDTLIKDFIFQPYNTFIGSSIDITKNGKISFLGSITKDVDSPEIAVVRRSDHCDTTNSISTPEIIMNQVVVFPNPMNNTSIIKFNNPRQEEFEIKLFDFSGQLVRRIKSIFNEEVVVNKGNLNSGIYFFYLTNNFKTRYSGKLLIK